MKMSPFKLSGTTTTKPTMDGNNYLRRQETTTTTLVRFVRFSKRGNLLDITTLRETTPATTNAMLRLEPAQSVRWMLAGSWH